MNELFCYVRDNMGSFLVLFQAELFTTGSKAVVLIKE